jgi:hypothetical protein
MVFATWRRYDGDMASLRRAWALLFAAAILVVACGSFSAAMAMDQSGCGDHAGKSGTMVGCSTTCLAVAPVVPVQPFIAPAAAMTFTVTPSLPAGAIAAPDPPPPRNGWSEPVFHSWEYS